VALVLSALFLSIASGFGWVLGQLLLAILVGLVVTALIVTVGGGNLGRSKTSLGEIADEDIA
jgi:hypothetical protein